MIHLDKRPSIFELNTVDTTTIFRNYEISLNQMISYIRHMYRIY